MQRIMYIIAVILIIGWAIGYIGYGIGGMVHVLLIIAAVAAILQLVRGNKNVN
jgi:hypothetical protein